SSTSTATSFRRRAASGSNRFRWTGTRPVSMAPTSTRRSDASFASTASRRPRSWAHEARIRALGLRRAVVHQRDLVRTRGKVLCVGLGRVAVAPELAGLERANDRVLGGVVMLGRVLVARVVAAADVPARQAEAQVDPFVTHREALVAPLRARNDARTPGRC